MRRIALLFVTMLALGALAMPAMASEGAAGEEKKAENPLIEELQYGAPAPETTVSDEQKTEALAAVAAEPSAVPLVITFGMFAVVVVTIGAGVIAYRRA